MKVKTKENIHPKAPTGPRHQNLLPNKLYNVIGIDHENFRVINEAGEPILYPKSLFTIIDSTIPDNWVKNQYSEDEYYIDPPELSTPGFYEDFFDRRPMAVRVFMAYISSHNV